ncbi:type III pantothenate kinase [Flavicella sediminum]|uniref:type III pantothenate kinase n=1 Tax=Flavicella sediminum TaxID=2585141 RepID=UPI00111D6D74|nr:type III pantothenate kinase [Flavicella sediminum]
MKNLIIDAGNSRIKVFVFERDSIVFSFVSDENDFEEKIKNIFIEHEIFNTIVSSVGALTKKIAAILKNVSAVVWLNSQTKVPFINSYKTPITLGVDRIALMSAASFLFPNKNVLVIDAGTCITFDILSETNNYLGGAISLGLQMRFTALHNFTENLPLLTIDNFKNFIGDDTNSCIGSGVVQGAISEIDGVISEYKCRFSDLTVVLTGGDAYYLSKRLKNSIFANPNFLAEGLNSILTHNTQE